MGNPFFDVTTVTATAPGRYQAFLDDSWNFRLPQGGVAAAVALRAMADHLGDDTQTLRTLHTAFVAQVTDGPVDIDVELLRRGRSMSHLRAELTNVGAPRGHVTTAIFGRDRPGFRFTDMRPPQVAPPARCRSRRDPVPPGQAERLEPANFWDQRVESKSALGHAPWEQWVPERAEHAAWFRIDEPPFADDGTVDPLALVMLTDMMPAAAAEKLGPMDRTWYAPSVDLTVHLLDDCRSEWVLAHSHTRHADDGYASAEMALWDCGADGTGTPRLVTYATQLFLFSFPD